MRGTPFFCVDFFEEGVGCLLFAWGLLEDDDICTRTSIGTDVEEMLEVIIVVSPIEDGDAVDLVGDVEESLSIAICLYGLADVLHFLPIDGSFWFAILIGSACLYFDEVQCVVFHGDEVEFTSSMKSPVAIQYHVSIIREIERSQFFSVVSYGL